MLTFAAVIHSSFNQTGLDRSAMSRLAGLVDRREDNGQTKLDEVDIHLNPKIGPDWMNRGKQKTVLTPGQNVKHYVAGALDAQTGELICVDSDHKNSLLVIALLQRLVAHYPQARTIHVILDNFKIHDSKATRAAVAALAGKVVLHFLPPYCPGHNKIERTWKGAAEILCLAPVHRKSPRTACIVPMP